LGIDGSANKFHDGGILWIDPEKRQRIAEWIHCEDVVAKNSHCILALDPGPVASRGNRYDEGNMAGCQIAREHAQHIGRCHRQLYTPNC